MPVYGLHDGLWGVQIKLQIQSHCAAHPSMLALLFSSLAGSAEHKEPELFHKLVPHECELWLQQQLAVSLAPSTPPVM